MRSSVRPPGARLVAAPAAVEDDLVRWCGDCRDERPFERLPCSDGHDDECPDVVCTGCGGVVVVGVLALLDVPPVAAASAA